MASELPKDQELREQFAQSLSENFSVACPAGSGKTRAITDRIAAMAKRPNAAAVLPRQVVVTFTQKAAREIRERAHASILSLRPSPAVTMAFNRAFFGTIHSFAVMLLRQFGHYLGIPALFEVLENDDAAWRAFLQAHSGKPSRMNADSFALLTRVYPFESLLGLVRSYNFTNPISKAPAKMPILELGEVLAVPLPKRAAVAANILAHQQTLREWALAIRSPGDFLPLPSPGTGGAEFLAAAHRALAPVRQWIGKAAAEAVASLAEDYRDWRISKGMLTFNDQVALAAELFRNGRAARAIRAKGYSVILDEAQDTDPHQFSLLVEMTRPVEAGTKNFLETLQDGPRPGHFSMVGDPQQSIYGSRADLGYYLAMHRALLVSGCAKEIRFDVTFRCDQAVVDFANSTFPIVLHGCGGQVTYGVLESRPGVSAGQVVRLPIAPPAAQGSSREHALVEARQLGQWLRETGLDGLRAKRWSEVAIICPRKAWFTALRTGLRDAGLESQLQSTSEIRGDSPAYAWFTALVKIFAEPRNAVEIFGVLREVFGVSDHEIAVFVARKPEKLQIAIPATGVGPVSSALRLLHEARDQFSRRPLREALGDACQRLNLAGRLASLPANQYPTLGLELETMLLRASQAEAEGLTLEEFAQDLQSSFSEQEDIGDAVDSAVTIITNLKAKGLQWDCVVLPYLGREISFRSEPYPRLMPTGCPVPMAFGAGEIPEEWSVRLELARFHELERLMYVSVTRAKHTLVLCDDVALWSEGTAEAAKNSLAKTLRLDTDNRAAWLALPPHSLPGLDGESEPSAVPSRRLKAPDLGKPGMTEIGAKPFPRRILPHTLAGGHIRSRRIEDPEQSATVHPDALVPELEDDLGCRYGSWWHLLMLAMTWGDAMEGGDRVFGEMLSGCPDPERARAEWALFKKSKLAHRLFSGRLKIHAELPFMAPLSNGDSVDGIMDLAAYDPEEQRWIVVDWKTNRGADADELLARYALQVGAYKAALAALTGEPVDAVLYPTATGELIAA